MKTKKRVRRLLSLWLSLVMIVSNLAGLVPGMSLTAHADTPYGGYLVNGDDDSESLQGKVVHFNNYDWYIIKDESTSATSGTVTLLAQGTAFGTAKFHDSYSAPDSYANSTLKGYLDSIVAGTAGTGKPDFSGVASAINDTGNGKLYLLSVDEAKEVPKEVLKADFPDGGYQKGWWLRTPDSEGDYDFVRIVTGDYGLVVGQATYDAELGVRPALKLDLSKVTFDSDTKIFELTSVVEYPLWVGGVQVTSANKDDVLGNTDEGATVVFTPAVDDNAATTDVNESSPATLTLNGADISGGNNDSEYAAIYAKGLDLTINVTENSTVTGPKTNDLDNSEGIYIDDGCLTITGSGRLTTKGGESAFGCSYGIDVDRAVTINGSLNASGGETQGAVSCGIYAGDGITVRSSEMLAASGGTGEAGSYGIWANVTVDGSLSAIGNSQAIYGTVKNSIAGTGWTDTEGTTGKTSIAVSEAGQELNSYKKVQFPAVPDPVAYIDHNATTGTAETKACTSYTAFVEGANSTLTTIPAGWYVIISGNAIATNRLVVSGTVNLILCDGATLIARKGITVTSGNTLNIYAGSIDETILGTGKLYAGTTNGIDLTCEGECAGIGGNVGAGGGKVTIHGGEVTALGNTKGAGIGGGNGGAGGTVTIYGGTVTTAGNGQGKGIGAGQNGTDNGKLTLGTGLAVFTSNDNSNWTDTTSSLTTRTHYMKVVSTVPVTVVSLDKTDAQTINVGGSVSFNATVTPDGATDKTVKWSVGGTDAGAVKLYSDEACTTEVGTDATETLTVYAKGISAGSATVTATSNADSTKSASCDVTVNAAQTQTETLLTTITATGKEQASYSVANVATVSFSSLPSTATATYGSNYLANWGWWGYGWTATVTPANGYTITKCVFYDDANRTATDSEAPFVVETTEEDKTPQVNGTPILANQSKGITKIEVYGYATPAATHSVTITAGSNMTKTETSGAASQTGLSGAMTDVFYTADDGYYFPENYSVEAVNEISVTRNSYTQITVSGTPTADAEITLTAPTAKTTPASPTTAAAVDCTTSDNNDGKLTGVTTEMEYKKSDATEWTAGTGSDITGLVPGTYYVRVKATETTNASTNQELTIKGFISYTVTFKVVNGKWNEGEGDAATADKTVTLTGHDGDTLKLTADQIPAVGSKPSDTYKAGNWDVTPSTETAITEATTYTYTYAAKEASVVTKAPTAKTLTYTGSAQELVIAGTATGGEMQYALGTAAKATQTYTTSIPAKTDARTYYVWYRVRGDANHADSTPVCITVTIEAASLSDRGVTVYAIPDQNYTGKAIEPKPVVKYLGYLLKEGTDYTLSYTNNTARWESGADQPAVTITGMGNYSGTLTAGFKIIVPAYEGILSLSLQESITYGTPLGYAPEVMSTGNLNGETTNVYYSNSNSGEGTLWDSTKILNAGTWYVWAELDATAAHDKAVSKRQTLTVNKAQYETPVAGILPEQTDASYEVSVVLPAGAKNTDYEYAITEGTSVVSEWSTLPVIKGGSFAPAGLSAGTEYTISLRRKADANHFASEAVSKTFSTPAQVVLSYDANGGSGSVSASKAYTSGDNTDPLDNGSGISRYGYSFAGWNTKADGSGDSFAAGTVFMITASTTLYAKWTPDNYTVSFNANGGTGSMADQNFTWGTAQALNANAFTKTSYTFAGWSDSAAGAVVYTDTQKVNNLAAGGTVTLYAVWLENSYSVSGNVMEYLDGSTDPSIVADVSVKLMRGIVQFGQETKTDSNGEYSFTGVTAGMYNIVASKSGTSADDSRTMTALVTVSDSDKTVDTIYLPAQKVNSVVTVSENTPPVMVGELDEVAKENAEDGKTVTVTMSVEAKDESAAEGAEELKELAESSSVTGADVEMDYLAISINKVVSANSAPTLTTAIIETEQVLEIIVPFNFEGRKNCGIWRYHQDEAQGFEKLDTRPASVAGFRDATFYEDRENSSLHLYGAFFSTYAISYETSSDVTILFKANDGTDTQKTQTITLGAAAALTANSFSRSGYSFTGWNTEADGSGTAYTDQQAITATADLLLYAQWQQNPPAPGPTYFSISFEMNGHGTQIPSKSVAYGAKLEKPEDPIEEGFIFGGWFTDEGLTQEYDFTQAVTSGFKLYAKWTEQTKPGVSLNSISIYTPPAKTEYVEGEKFDPTGMVVSANYTDNSSREVTTYTYTPSGNLAVSDNEITVSYTEEGITRTATQKISVSANITPPGPGPEPGPAEEVDLWNLFEDDSVHEYTVSGVTGGDSIANSNTKSAAFFDAVLDGDTISVSLKSGADRKKAANKANTVLSFALEDGSRVEYLLPVKYVKPSLKLSTKSVSIKEGSKAEVETTILIKAAGNGYEPMDLDGAEVKFNGADADILENGKIRVIAEAAGSGKISVSKPGWESAIELAFTVKTVKKNVLSVDLGGAKYVTLNSNAKNQNFDFPVFLNGEAAGEVSILDKKDSGIASYADGVLTIAYPEAGVKAGSYNIILKTEDASCSVKVKVSDKELSKAVTLKVKSRYDVVSGEPMVITPVLKDVSGEITSVSLDKEGFSAELNENGNIVVNYEGSAYDVKHLDIGTLEFKLGISGADEEVTISLPKVKAKKSVPAVKAAKVTVAKDAAGDVIAVANIVCTYKGSDGRYHSIAPENVKITKLSKGTEAALSEDDPTLVNITKLEKKSGTIKVALSFKGGMTKNVTIRVKKSK